MIRFYLVPLFLVITAFPIFKMEASEVINVTFISPNPPGEGYWEHYDKAMKSAAADLNIHLSIIHAQDLDRFAYIDALELVNRVETDYVIALLRHNVADKLLKMFANSDVKVFASNMEVPEMHKEQTGKPREIYKNWIGQIMPDDYHAGHLLAQSLISEASRHSVKSSLVALSGSRDSSVSFLRNEGLQHFLESQPDYPLAQVLHTDWKYSTTREKFHLLLNRHNQARIIWCASDEIATAVLASLSKYQHKFRYFVGSIDWSVKGISAFGESPYVTSIGGHFLEGGIVLALIRDHHDGLDFASDLGTQIRMKMSALNEHNLPILKDVVLNNQWQKLKFDRLSKSMQGQRQLLTSNYEEILKHIYQP